MSAHAPLDPDAVARAHAAIVAGLVDPAPPDDAVSERGRLRAERQMRLVQHRHDRQQLKLRGPAILGLVSMIREAGNGG